MAAPTGPQRDLYRLVVEVFAKPLYVLFYVACMGIIFMHLSHGVSSAMQSLGVNHPRYDRLIRVGGSVARRGHRRRLRAHPDARLRRGAAMTLDAKIPGGPIEAKWERHKFESKLVAPANRRKFTVIVVGTGLAGGSASASLGELGYNVLSFCIHDSPRRAHSIAAQGGINAAKNYRNDGDSVYRLFYDTVKGGDYRAREANVYRLAQLSVNIIDQCVAQGVPFAREYGGLLDNRSFGGAQVSRTFYARGQTGQQLLLGAYQSMMRQVDAGTVTVVPQREMLDLVVVDGTGARHHHAQPRHRRTRALARRRRLPGDRRLRHGLLPLDQRGELERHGGVARAQARRALRQSVLHADSPDVHSRSRRPSVEAHADEREPAQRRPGLGAEEPARPAAAASRFPTTIATTTSSAAIRASATWCPRDVASRAAKAVCDEGRGVGETGLAVYLDFADAIHRLGAETHQAALRQPVRDVREDHRREPVRGADADLPRRPLHDGRPVGGLQPDEQPPRPVRARRGQLLRSRRQPAGRERAHAGTGRRLLRHPGHAQRTTWRPRRCRR